MMIQPLAVSAFQESLHTMFRVRTEATPEVDLVLNKVVDRSSPGQERFSIYLRGPSEAFLPQRLYRMEHDRLGAVDIFIVPVASDPDGYTYEAVFNRLKD